MRRELFNRGGLFSRQHGVQLGFTDWSCIPGIRGSVGSDLRRISGRRGGAQPWSRWPLETFDVLAMFPMPLRRGVCFRQRLPPPPLLLRLPGEKCKVAHFCPGQQCRPSSLFAHVMHYPKGDLKVDDIRFGVLMSALSVKAPCKLCNSIYIIISIPVDCCCCSM